jgi:RND family efflux transporter MFP subunit
MDKPRDSIEDEIPKDPPNGRLRPFVILFWGLMIAALILTVLFPRLAHIKKLESEAAWIAPTPIVRVIPAKPEYTQFNLELPSFLQAINITPVWAMTNGYLKIFYVDIGDQVKGGQLMAEIETPEVDAALAQARSDLASYQSRLEIARITAERWHKVYNRNAEAISVQEVEEKSSTFETAEANVKAAIANVKRLEAMQAYNKIYAPFDGIVIQRTIDIGTLISSGSNGNPQQLYQVAKTDVIRAFIDVPQPYFRLIKDGMEAEITVGEYPDKPFKGAIARNAGALTPIARTLLTQVNIENRDGELLAGLYATVKLNLKMDNPVYVLPIQALIIRNGPTYVAIVDQDNKAHLNQVEIGLNFGKSVQIISGIRENDLIIINPTDLIQDGVKIEIEKGELTAQRLFS